MLNRFSVALSTAMLAAFASTASAQATQTSNPVELGIDAVIATTLGNTKVTTVSIPSGDFRVGFFVNNNLSIEPRVGLNSVSGGGSTYTMYNAQIGALYHFSTAPVGAGVYIRPFAGLVGVSGGGSSTQGDVGIGLGTKIPFAERLATRIEVSYMHAFSSNMGDSGNQLAASIGLSFFTK
ncbi:MAG: outer membrane beta-barrel protein [Gemmatimonadaceae bacterium]